MAIQTVAINTDTHVVVPVELLKKARLCIEDYIEGAPSDGTDEKCMDDISAILATKQPEQAQQSDGTVINYGTMVSAEFLECFNHAFSFLANGHSIGQCFDMMKFARAELIKSMKSKTAPRPVPTIERLPTEADADCFGNVWLRAFHCEWEIYHWTLVTREMVRTEWQPTGLTRPAEPDGGAV